MIKATEKALEACARAIHDELDPNESMKLSQSVLNLAHALNVLGEVAAYSNRLCAPDVVYEGPLQAKPQVPTGGGQS